MRRLCFLDRRGSTVVNNKWTDDFSDPMGREFVNPPSVVTSARSFLEKFGYRADYEEFLLTSQCYRKLIEHPLVPVAFDLSYDRDVDAFKDATRYWPTDCQCTESFLDLEFSPSDQSCWRAPGGRTKPFAIFKKLFGSKWSCIFTAYCRLLPPEVKHRFTFIMCANIKHKACESCLIEHIKKISLVALALNIEQGPGWWSFLADVHVIGGYDTVLNRVDVLADYAQKTQWVRGTDNQFLRDSIDKTVDGFGISSVANQITFAQFVRFRDTWATPGASTHGTPSIISIKGEKTKVRGKFANTLSMTDDEIVKLCHRGDPAVIRPFRKVDEPVKTRVVQAYDLPSYIRCSYVDFFISNLNASTVWTTLGMSVKERAESRLRLSLRLRQKNITAVSTDQSAFDENQIKSIVRYALESIWRKVIRSARKDLVPELSRLCQAELKSFDEAVIQRVDRGKTTTISAWIQGLPSGFRWTALIDSLLNKAESEYCAHKMNFSIADGMWQGDDAVMLVEGPCPTPEAIAKFFEGMGLSVNSAKTWVNPRRYEFLHEINGPEGAWGFPARIAKTILWRKPKLGSSNFTPPHLEISEYWDTLLKASRRGLKVYDLHHASVVKLLQHRNVRNASKIASDYLNTPLALGGGGLGFSGRVSGTWKPPKILWKKVSLVNKLGFSGPGDHCIYERCMLRRLGRVARMPSRPAEFITNDIRPSNEVFSVRDLSMRIPQTDWVPWDYTTKKVDAWSLKLRLEDRLNSGQDITEELCPSSVIKRSKLGCNRAMRLINRWSGISINLANAYSSAEPFAPAADWANRIWNGIVANTALGASKSSDLHKEAAKLAYQAYKRAVMSPAGVRTAV